MFSTIVFSLSLILLSLALCSSQETEGTTIQETSSISSDVDGSLDGKAGGGSFERYVGVRIESDQPEQCFHADLTEGMEFIIHYQVFKAVNYDPPPSLLDLS